MAIMQGLSHWVQAVMAFASGQLTWSDLKETLDQMLGETPY
jgi:hypothetical protein